MPTSLVLDDEPSIRKLIRSILAIEHIQTIEAENGARGLEIMRESGSTVDLIISDIRMPDVDGISFARSVRQTHPRVPIILVSGYLEGEKAPDCDGFVEKPFRVGTLLDVVRGVLAGPGARAA